jgi:hypothetical protein
MTHICPTTTTQQFIGFILATDPYMSYLNSYSWASPNFLRIVQSSYHTNDILVSEEQGFYLGQYTHWIEDIQGYL